MLLSVKVLELTLFQYRKALYATTYVACLGQQGLAHSSIRTYLSGVRQLQIAHGFKDINYNEMPRLWQIIKGVQIDQGRKGRVPRRHLPITPLILRKMKSVWLSEKSDPDNLMLWAASTTAFFGFCRSGEVTTGSDDKIDPHTHLSLKTWQLITLQLHP